jgi:hypothetical protein
MREVVLYFPSVCLIKRVRYLIRLIGFISALQAVLRIRDVFTGSRIQGQKDPGSGFASRNFKYFQPQKMFPSSRENDFEMLISDPDFFPIPDPVSGSRVQGVTKAPDSKSESATRLTSNFTLLLEK